MTTVGELKFTTTQRIRTVLLLFIGPTRISLLIVAFTQCAPMIEMTDVAFVARIFVLEYFPPPVITVPASGKHDTWTFYGNVAFRTEYTPRTHPWSVIWPKKQMRAATAEMKRGYRKCKRRTSSRSTHCHDGIVIPLRVRSDLPNSHIAHSASTTAIIVVDNTPDNTTSGTHVTDWFRYTLCFHSLLLRMTLVKNI